jgi:radical S-adenosyl methionine domain-containing protein 2
MNRHKHLKCFTPESNKLMSSSYLILDEYLCFLDKGDGLEGKSDSVLKIGVAKALQQVKWDEESFYARGGIYDWSAKKSGNGNGCSGGAGNENLEW